MSRLSNDAENKGLGLLMGGTAWSLATKRLGLATATMDDTTTGATVTEPTGTYVRISTDGSDFPAAASGQVSNNVEKSFAVVDVPYTATWMFLADAATLGNIVWYDQLNASKSPGVGATPKIGSGQIALNLSRRHLGTVPANAILDHITGEATYTPPATYHLGLGRRRTALGTTTFDSSTDVCTLNSHGLAAGDAVQFTNSGGALPTGLAAQTRYFAYNVAANTFQLTTNPNDATTVVDFSSNGTGTTSVYRATNPDGAYHTEADYGSSARISKTNNTTNFPAPSGGTNSNGTAVTWSTADWSGGTDLLSEFTVWDAAISSGSTVTFTNATNKVNLNSHGLANGTKIIFRNSGGALPTGLEANRVYFVINAATNDFEISELSGGSAVDFTTDGTGTTQRHTVGNLIWVSPMTNTITPSSGDSVEAAIGDIDFAFD